MAAAKRVAVMIDLDWPYKHHLEVFTGIMRYGRQAGWDCRVVPLADTELRAGGRRKLYDGIVARATPELAARAKQARVPLVNVWMNSPVRDVPTVVGDSREVGRLAARHLMARGFRNFAFLGFRRDRSARYQARAFTDVLKAQGHSVNLCRVPLTYAQNSRKWNGFLDQINAWIASWALPIGVHVSFDLLARYLADACGHAGVRVPEDASIVSCHNETIICNQPEPSLSSIDFGCERQGYRAAEVLADMMAGTSYPPEPIWVPPGRLHLRRSSDVFAVEDALVSQAMRFIAENADRPIRVRHVAEAVPTSRRSLERRFREKLGRSVAEEIARLRIERAKRMLVESDEPIKRLATACGFPSTKQMWKVFRRVEGIAPDQFRRRRREK